MTEHVAGTILPANHFALQGGQELLAGDDPAWVTREGLVLLIRDMDTSHIRNCILTLRRTSDRPMIEKIKKWATIPKGEHAEDAFHEWVGHLGSASAHERACRWYEPVYGQLWEEYQRREGAVGIPPDVLHWEDLIPYAEES